ncbi:hypothetical protein AYO37_00680 [Opitutia bacterium SCGC AG-212-L18]|nr:hypothetical protein AYO37_00680 [Opitutae bacterium SCGC AG-212-L18]
MLTASLQEYLKLHPSIFYKIETQPCGRQTVKLGKAILRSYGCNPFGSNEQFHKSLMERELTFIVDAYQKTGFKDEGTDPLLSIFKEFEDAEIEKLENIIKKLKLFLSALNQELAKKNLKVSPEVLAIIASTYWADVEKSKPSDKLTQRIASEFNQGLKIIQESEALQKIDNPDLHLLTANILRDVVSNNLDQKKSDSQKLRSKVKETLQLNDKAFSKEVETILQLKIDEFIKKTSFESKNERLHSIMKGEFIFDLGLFFLEALFTRVSSSFAFSLSNSYGIASFGVSLFVVISTLPYFVGLMEGAWKELASYGSAEGAKTLSELKTKILQHAQESWNKATNSDKSFHPLFDGLLGAIYITLTWPFLASYEIASHAVFYLVLDSYLGLKASFIENKDFQLTMRDFFISCIGGITRGFVKDMLKTKAYGPTYCVQAGLHEAAITWASVVFGQIFRTIFGQFLNANAFAAPQSEGSKTKTE